MRRVNPRHVCLLMILIGFTCSIRAYACNPLPVLLYPADEVYRSKGLEIPELPEDSIARMNGEYLSKADYKEWLYEKIGFDPEMRREFLINRCLKIRFESKGIDTEHQKELVFDNFIYFNSLGVCKRSDDWVAMTQKKDVVEPPFFREGLPPRIEKSYLEALYVIEYWETIYNLGLENFGVEFDSFSIQGEDEEVKNIVKLNNAYDIRDKFSSFILPHIINDVLAGEDLNLPDHTEEFKEWIYTYYHSVYLLETYLGMFLCVKILFLKTRSRFSPRSNLVTLEERRPLVDVQG